MGSFKFGFKIEKGEAAKIRIKIDISGIPDEVPKEWDLRPAHAGPATGTTLPLPFPQLPDETEPMEKVSIPKGPPGFWQRIFSRFRNR